MDIEKRLLEGNKVFIDTCVVTGEQDYFKTLAKGQNPFALIICCSDSRVIPEQIFSARAGELFVIRTAGNVINEGELATVEYAIEHLHIGYILVLGHTHCGAVHASMHDEKGEYLSPIIDNIKANIKGIKDEKEASIMNALRQKEYILTKFPKYQGIVKHGVYDIDTLEVKIF